MTGHPDASLARLLAGVDADAREKERPTEEPPAHPLEGDADWFYSDEPGTDRAKETR